MATFRELDASLKAEIPNSRAAWLNFRATSRSTVMVVYLTWSNVATTFRSSSKISLIVLKPGHALSAYLTSGMR